MSIKDTMHFRVAPKSLKSIVVRLDKRQVRLHRLVCR